jgi:hypothetical protein
MSNRKLPPGWKGWQGRAPRRIPRPLLWFFRIANPAALFITGYWLPIDIRNDNRPFIILGILFTLANAYSVWTFWVREK